MTGQLQTIGRYHLEEEIHRGPSASVYRGLIQESGEPVAIKLFHARHGVDPRFAIRFRQHLRRLSAVTDENLVAVLDYGLVNGRYYIVTEWVEGVDLAAYLIDHGSLPPWWAATVARQVCGALGAVHEAGLIHRGIKPANLLLTAQGQVKVTDVGMSSLISDTGLSRTNVMLGSVGYISPEQARAQPVSPASDLYSLGVVLFEMLTGRLPFVSQDAWTMVRLHAEGLQPSPRQLAPQVPEDLALVVQRLLEKDPARRFTSAEEFEAALAAVLESGSLSQATGQAVGAASSPTRWTSWLGKWVKRGAWKELLAVRVPLGFLRVSLPFGFLLAFQFLLSFLLALGFLYALVLVLR